jgi:phage baseplate assembly protein W|tara:strand:- start:1669 stop:2106 length:438 start_codon:yes stop_codon:yes gene_type:complete
MAYVIGRKVVKDTKDFDSYAYGITLPLRRGETGFFEQAFVSFEQAKSNLKNLLLTRKGERVMQPNFGTGLHSLLFEQIDDTFESRVQETITKNVNYWLPYVNIKNIDVEMTDELKDQNRVNLSLEFTVGNQIDLHELTFTVQGTN